MTKTKGKTKNTKSEKTKRESGEMSPAKKLFRLRNAGNVLMFLKVGLFQGKKLQAYKPQEKDPVHP